MGIYNGEPKASCFKRPYRSEANILLYLGNKTIEEICIKGQCN